MLWGAGQNSPLSKIQSKLAKADETQSRRGLFGGFLAFGEAVVMM